MLVTGAEVSTGHTDFINTMAFHPSKPILATGSQDNSIILWDLDNLVTIDLPLTRHTSGVTSLAFSPSGALLASSDEDATWILWDVATRQPIGIPITGSPAAVTGLAFSQDEAWLYTGNGAGSIFKWDVGFESWIERTCGLAQRNLSQAEFNQYFHDEIYRISCPDYPAGN